MEGKACQQARHEGEANHGAPKVTAPCSSPQSLWNSFSPLQPHCLVLARSSASPPCFPFLSSCLSSTPLKHLGIFPERGNSRGWPRAHATRSGPAPHPLSVEQGLCLPPKVPIKPIDLSRDPMPSRTGPVLVCLPAFEWALHLHAIFSKS